MILDIVRHNGIHLMQKYRPFQIYEDGLKIDDDDKKICQLTKAIMHELKLQL